ncbi:EthD domain-containing protein [Xylaria cubensis]|nr:EthD domain-containing protein [Xylaria cubensis]
MPWEKFEHEFTHPQLDYSSEPNFQPCVKVSIFFKKLDSVDYDTFFGHWQTVHADLVVATQAFRKNIVRYAQHHQTPEMKERMRSLGVNVFDYDGCAQIWVRTWDDWLSFYNSKEFSVALVDDCHRFMTLPMTYMVGYENLIVGDGSKALGGKDGIDITKSN